MKTFVSLLIGTVLGYFAKPALYGFMTWFWRTEPKRTALDYPEPKRPRMEPVYVDNWVIKEPYDLWVTNG